MAAYSTSETTKRRLIMAAGELFAQNGIKAVTTRTIAEKAGENLGLIKYHFGNKDGLLDAVIDYAIHPWTSNPLKEYLAENERLFASAGGQEELVGGLITLFFEVVFSKERPAWCGMLMFQILQRNLPASKKIFDRVAVPILDTFSSVFRRITGDEDSERAFCWIVTLTSPAHLLSIDPHTFKKIHKNKTAPDSILLKLREMTIRSALTNLGAHRTRQDSIILQCGASPQPN